MHMRDKHHNFLVDRTNLMEEYFCNTKQFTEEFREVSKLNEDILASNPYSSRLNVDNYPTHRRFKGMVMRKYIDDEGEEYEVEEKDYFTYCAASK